MRGLWLRVLRLLRWQESEQETEEELRLHIEMEAERLQREGLEPAEARRQARLAFGAPDRWREEVRTARGTVWIEDSLRDLRHAIRGLVRAPGFAIVAVSAIALGIGATTAVYSVVDQIVLSPLPYPRSAELVTVWMQNPRQGTQEDVTSWPNFVDWRAASTTVQGLATVRPVRSTLTGEGEPEVVGGATVSRGFFELIGAPLAHGRTYREDEVEGPVAGVVVISDGLYKRRYGADPSILGHTIYLDDAPYTVIGVTRPGAGYPADAEFWTPQAFPPDYPLTMYPRRRLLFPVIGRLNEGLPLQAAQAEMDAIAARLQEAYPEDDRGVRIGLEPLHETIVGDVRTPLLVLLAAVSAVLLIAVVNVANMLIARGSARSREMAVRLAIGAGKGRLLRQMLTESAVLGGLGGLAGAALAAAGIAVLVAVGPSDLPRLAEVGPDRLILAVAVAVTLATTFAFGLIPALQAGRVDPAANLRTRTEAGSTGSLGRMRGAFVAGQFALALVLLIGAGLFLRSLRNLQGVDPGFESKGILRVTLDLSRARYPDSEARGAFYHDALERVAALPGVTSVGTISNLFLEDRPSGTPAIEGRPDQFGPDMQVPSVSDVISPGFFSTVGLELVAGRGPRESDGPGDLPVAVVNEAFARRFLAGLDPVGQRFTWLYIVEGSYWFTIVGVVKDARRSGLALPARPAVYYAIDQRPGYHTELLVRTAGDPLSLAPAVRNTLHAVDPQLPVSHAGTLEQAMADQLAPRRYVSWLLGLLALSALALAAIGIFGVMAYAVGRRIREFGIRLALGADASRLLIEVLREGLLQAGAGLIAGTVAALLLTRFVQSQMFGLEALDPVTFIEAAGVLLAVALAACAVPARRAARVDAMVAIREE